MDKKKELTKNTILIFISKFFTSTITFLLIPLYTRYLKTDDYGYIDLIQTYIILIVPILLLRFDSAIFRFLIDARNDDDEKKQVISISILITFIQCLFFVILMTIINSFIEIKFFKHIVINIIIMGISQLFLQASRGLGNIKDYSISSIVSGIISVICNFIFIVILKKGAEYILISSTIGNFFTILYIVIINKIYKYANKNYLSVKKMKEMIFYSLPMIPDGLSWWVVNVSDRTIITSILGTAANGIYAISGKFSNILATIFGIFNMAWQENASVHINDSDRDEYFSDIFNTTLMIYSSICFLIIAILPICFNVLVGNDYINSYNYIPILIIGNIFNGMSGITGGIYIGKKATKSVAKTTILSAIINIIINILLIKKIGLWAACISTLISYIFLCIYRYVNIKKEFNININLKSIISILIIGIISSIFYYINIWYINILNLIIVLLWIFIFNKKIIVEFISLFINKIKMKK